MGNAPTVGGSAFNFDSTTAYYLPCASGWSNSFAGLPALPWWQALFNYMTNAGAITITGYSGLCENVIIPAAINGLPVTSIGANAFYRSTNLTSVIIPNGVTSIGAASFEGCTSLRDIMIPSSVTNIGEGAFAFCESLTNVTIENGVDSIGNFAFYACTQLTSVTIPSSVTNVWGNAFEDTKVNSFYFTGNAPASNPFAYTHFFVATVYYLPGTTGWGSYFAYLPVMWNPQIQMEGASFGVLNNRFGFNITGTNNFVVVVETCTNLARPVWTILQTVTLTNGSYYFSDPEWTNYPSRYYGLGLP
jgi:hypothetical protein